MGLGRAALLLGAAAACSGKSRVVGDAAYPNPGDATGSAAVGSAGIDAGSAGTVAVTPDAPPTTGDVQVRVEWKNVPVPARASPGLTPCKTPRAPAVAPTTTWGIPDALVFVDGVRVAGTTERVVLADCALAPRLAIAGTVVVASGVGQPAEVTIARRGATEAVLGGALEKAAPRTLRLPIAGHAVSLELEPDAIYELRTTDPEPETAWIAASAAAISDPSGVALIQGVTPGSHAVVAWLPPRGGQKARVARGTVVVEVGDLAELTLLLE